MLAMGRALMSHPKIILMPEGSLTVQERLEPHETALIEVEQIL